MVTSVQYYTNQVQHGGTIDGTGTAYPSGATEFILSICSCIYCRKTDENDLFNKLDNNKQVEYRVKGV